MANTITHKRSSTSSETPSASDLSAGEIAINTADAKLFIKKSDDSIATFSTSPSANQSGIVSILNTNLIVGRNTYDMMKNSTCLYSILLLYILVIDLIGYYFK